MRCSPENRFDLVHRACVTFELEFTGFQQGRLHVKPSVSRAPGRRLQSSENYQFILLSFQRGRWG